ncbi:MAG: copper chaperone PCu(A)C [Anaerolineae bacterium]|nr:copper chaperone PCu(A)C [Anaerolineae bacterium]
MMTIHKTARSLLLMLFVSLLAAAGIAAQGTADTDLVVTGAWARPADQMSAAYLQISNQGAADDQLVAVETTAGMAEIHTTWMDNDVMRMRPIEAIDIPAGETVMLAPGGLHIMLMRLRAPLVEGETLPLTLVFASGVEIPAEAIISHVAVPLRLEADTLTEQALAAASERYVGQVANPPVQVQDFAAPGNTEELTRLSDTNGTWRVIFFGYMHCPDFCPLTLVDYRDVKALLGEVASEITFTFISVDSARDTPERMARYLANFDPAFVGFSPDDVTLRRIQPDYDFYFERRMDEGTQAVYTIDHSTRSYLLDRNGVLRASFAYDTPPQQIADALIWYLEHE